MHLRPLTRCCSRRLVSQVAAEPTGPSARRFAVRTGIAASVAVLALAGSAAALTGGLELLDSIIPGGKPTLSAVQETEPEPGETDETGGGESAADEGTAGGPELTIDDVNAEDGLDEAELKVLCDNAQSHEEYLAAVAKDMTTEVDGTHGDRVSEAAKSDCGKPDKGGDEAKADKPDKPDKPTGGGQENSGNVRATRAAARRTAATVRATRAAARGRAAEPLRPGDRSAELRVVATVTNT